MPLAVSSADTAPLMLLLLCYYAVDAIAYYLMPQEATPLDDAHFLSLMMPCRAADFSPIRDDATLRFVLGAWCGEALRHALLRAHAIYDAITPLRLLLFFRDVALPHCLRAII